MICANCKKTIPDDAEFCKFCGAPAPFSFGINYHPESLFVDGVGGGSDSIFASIENTLTEMEGRMNDRLSELSEKCSPKRKLLHQIQTIATLFLVAGMAVGTFMLTKACTQLDQISVQLEKAATADSEMKSSLDGLEEMQEAQKQIQADVLPSAEQTAETTEEEPVQSLNFQITFNPNYEGSEALEKIPPITMGPGAVASLATVVVMDREGYSLIGWNTKSDGTGEEYACDDSIGYFGYDVKLFAQWQENDPASKPIDNP